MYMIICDCNFRIYLDFYLIMSPKKFRKKNEISKNNKILIKYNLFWTFSISISL